MKDFQKRVVDEKLELDDRLGKLNAFIDGPQFGAVPDAERDRLLNQSTAMRKYSLILGERIRNFT